MLKSKRNWGSGVRVLRVSDVADSKLVKLPYVVYIECRWQLPKFFGTVAILLPSEYDTARAACQSCEAQISRLVSRRSTFRCNGGMSLVASRLAHRAGD